ncbi:hypothetical protein HS088_TW07G00900 [Tripterygium wilfordii]|uniref:Uncharacterized protein n=1 Tax=Tripterygium wilfordii TaxID=458696 RepID=A0A7J7DGY4_TRIWF|nr:uncharacterized protein LOC120001260 [Tripterygium wilfordii]KAF5745316.1 hypothetical protein HS088_TW07G00900 [Tripterygium wilfordii]
MEDWNTLAGDCVAISCCCQCLILQMVIFFLLKLPYKLIRKTKDYAKKRLWHRDNENKNIELTRVSQFQDEFLEIHGGSMRIQADEIGSHCCGCCIEEVERVLYELSQKGEFSFGSFWGREGSGSCSSSNVVSTKQFDISSAQFELVEIVSSLE